MRHAMLLVLGLAAAAPMEPPRCRLPQPHYHRVDTDPAWLSAAVQFHGHLGPWAAAGARLGMAGLREVEAEGYFDVQVSCEGPLAKPPQACFLDGLQVGTGATLGKRNLEWVDAAQLVVRVKNTRTGRQVEIRPTAKLLELLNSFKPQSPSKSAQPDDRHHHDSAVEALARKVAKMPDQELLTTRELP